MENENKKRGRPKKQKNMNSPLARRLRELSGTMTHQEIADGVGISRQTIGQFLLGNTQPDTETLCKLADFFKVSTDYLLGRTDVKSADTTLQDICKYTGLSEKAITLLSLSKDSEFYNILPIINFLIESSENSILLRMGEAVSIDSFCSDLLEKLYYYFKVDISDDSCFLIQQNGAIISSDEDDDTNSTKEDWDSQITVSSVLKKDIVDRVLVDNLIVELKKAKRDFDKQKKPAQDYSSEQA
ncbi:MAG: helix-turn-helix transcriptional regulator [Ruminococcus bicirculans]|nr:helix-turn-helix transcriptional regulator [Ruminococcus bicirculans (ex Wegman et al. 2014)]